LVTIAVDAMGGDNAPFAPVTAVFEAAGKFTDTNFILIGNESKMKNIVSGNVPHNITFLHTDVKIESDDEPVRAVRRKPDSSLVMAAKMVKEGQADVLMSAGNTGAIVAAGMLVVGRMKGVERPALAPVLPTFSGHGVMLLDAGATMDSGPQNLLDFAFMANEYSKYVLDIENPRIGLLNVGTEDMKGNAMVKNAFTLLKESPFNFIGNIEARDMMDGICDVVVCDGFVGNVVLKLAEGVALGIFGGLKETLVSSVTTRLAAGILKPKLKKFGKRFEYSEHGGAPFLGVAGGCFKAHGSSNPRAWFIALTQARKFAANNLVEKMTLAMGERL
jgi:phosphate acyltransferase